MVPKITVNAKTLQKMSESQKLGIRAVGICTKVVNSESRNAQPSYQSRKLLPAPQTDIHPYYSVKQVSFFIIMKYISPNRMPTMETEMAAAVKEGTSQRGGTGLNKLRHVIGVNNSNL